MTELTKEQISHWRNLLAFSFGPYAFIMPEDEIIKFRDIFQNRIDKIPIEEGEDED